MIKVIKFSAVWCGPCKTYDPIFSAVAEQFPDVTFEKVDIEDKPELTEKYNIRNVPTTIIEVDNEVKFRRSGVMTQLELSEEVKHSLK